jgi:(2R)-sulfolactate sulfo-lyase subunit alpha
MRCPAEHTRRIQLMSIPQLLVHDKRDNVGVVVVENLKAGDEMFCVVTEDDSDFTMVVKQDTGDHVHVHNLKTKRW